MATQYFDVIRLSPEQVQRNILPGDFDESHQMTGDASPPCVSGDCYIERKIHQTVPLGKGRGSGYFALVHHYTIEGDGYRNAVLGNYFEFHFGREARDCPFGFANSLDLPSNVMITSALYGDYNGDGRTDILIRLSDGGAYVFQQRANLIQVGADMVCRRPPPL